ncbi:hypothetical protein BET10_03105 [Pseudoalteromonas amylolytica]|uniref:Uncharacterized protein n=1 Tax=Pseudoalteromonas amylolytica TaxID=1859457 RepID=A0A1S1MW55_9GAMM|nr:hypothetical protein BET10_03105 [Pseudoalteromonas amylolytica]
MFKKYLFVLFTVIVFLVLLKFLQDEYLMWSDTLACSAKCELLGCKTGQLLLGRYDQTVACICESKHDYLVLLN